MARGQFTKLAGKKRPNMQEPSGFSTASTTKWDGNDALGQTRINKGTDPTYAIARDSINTDLRENRASSFIQLFGDSFATTRESYLALIEDATADIGTSPLTNNNTVTFVEETDDDESSLYLKTVGNFVSSSSQYLSIGTDSTLEVGTGSFIASIQFKTDTTGAAMTLFSYGDIDTNEGNWKIEITSANKIQAVADDGTDTSTVTDSIASRWQDDRYHTATMFLDTTASTDTLYLFVDGILIGSNAQALVTLDNATENFYIGAEESNTTKQQFFDGRLSNFHLIKAADWNAIHVLNMGVREGVIQSGDAFALTNNASARINNLFQFGGDDSDYVQTVISTDDGEYEIIELYEKDVNLAQVELYIDDFLIRSAVDTQNGSATYNNKTTTKAIKLTKGRHILKLKVNGTNGTDHDVSYQMIELIKRDGSDEGGATSGVLFGDEFEKRVGTWTGTVDANSIFNQYHFNSSQTANDSMTATLFMRKGLYRIVYTYLRAAGGAQTDLWISGNQILDSFDSTGSTQRNTIGFSGTVFIEGGKTEIKILAEDSAFVQFESIRFELVSGAGKGDTVEIFGADDDFQTVSGTDSNIVISTSARFNHYRNNATDLLNDEWVYRRYFSGGTYSLKYIYPISLDGGETDVSIDGSVVIDNLNQQGSASFDNEHFTVLEVPRGFQDINIKNVLDGDSSDFQALFQKILLQKIGDSQDAENDDSFDGGFGELVPLAKHIARKTESTVTLNLSKLQRNKFSKFVVEITGEVSGALALELKLNGLTSGYDYTTIDNDSGTGADGHTTAGAEIALLPNTLLDKADQSFQSRIEIVLEDSGDHIGFHAVSSAWNEGTRYADGHNTGTVTELNQILLETSTSTWKAGTEINVYGVRA